MNLHHFLRRGAAYATGLALTASGIALAAPSRADTTVKTQGTSDEATASINWLLGELKANGNRFTFPGGSFDDIGGTIDALLAVASAGRNADANAKAASDYVLAHANDYLTFTEFNDNQPASRPTKVAGAFGKVMLFAQARNLPTTDVGGHNLEPELRQMQKPSGRFSNDSPSGSDFSNGVTQSLDMMALSRTSGDVPATAVSWLLAQQCPNGGFRNDYTEGVACTSNDEADLDATSFAIQALMVSPLTDAQDAKIDDAVGYLIDSKASNGLIGNANSSGLAASALRTVGHIPAANSIATAVEKLQLTSGQVGAIALTPEDAADKKAKGIDDKDLPTYWRSTAQAVFALGIPSYVDRGLVPPVEPAPHVESSKASANQGDSITVTGGGFEAGEAVKVIIESDPVTVATVIADDAGEVTSTFSVPSSVPAGNHTIRLAGQSSGVTVTSPLSVSSGQVVNSTTTTTAAGTTTTTAVRSTIVRTGSTTDNQTLFGGALVIAGAGLVLATRRRKIVYPFKR